ncbi:MAG: hypothetical protein P3X24_000650 [bacterium]|nr:hypothetical protein [bacterium]
MSAKRHRVQSSGSKRRTTFNSRLDMMFDLTVQSRKALPTEGNYRLLDGRNAGVSSE